MEKLTKWQKAMLMIIGVPLGLYLMYTLAYPTYSWNQKLTVEVETPEGVVSGSSVVGAEVEFQPDLGFVEIASIYHDWHGEATIVELPNHQYLFVLLGDPIAMAQHSFKEPILGSAQARIFDVKSYYSKLEGLQTSVPVFREKYPLFVTFEDLNDPTSVIEVNPDILSATFGPGYSLKGIMLELTNDPAVQGQVADILPWWNNLLVPIGSSARRKNGKPLYGLKKWDFVKE